MPLFARRHARWNAAGIILLLAGLGVAGFIVGRAGSRDDSDDEDDILFEQTHSKAYDLAVQRNVGALGLLESRWSQSLEKLARPRPLAATILVVSGVTAAGCFLAASRAGD